MKLWRAEWQSPSEGTQWVWFGTKKEAEAFRSENEGDHTPVVEPVDFPTTKAALIRWLNMWAGDNNG